MIHIPLASYLLLKWSLINTLSNKNDVEKQAKHSKDTWLREQGIEQVLQI